MPTASASLSLDVRLAGSAIAGAGAAANLVLSIPLSGAAVAQAQATGALVLTITLTGAAISGSSADGGLAGTIRLAGDAVAGATASAVFTDAAIAPKARFTLTAATQRRTLAANRPSHTLTATARRLELRA